MARFTPTLVEDYDFLEITSNLEKMCRRGEEYKAAYSAFLLHTSGYGLYLWRRLVIISCEDVGNGDSQTSILVSSLFQSWLQLHKHNKQPTLDKFLLPLQAVLYICKCSKSRECDSLANLIEEHFKTKKRLTVDPISKDSHTSAKKTLGRFGDLTDGKEKMRLDKWFNEGSVINNQAYPDKWQKELAKIWYSRIPEDKK